MNPPTLADQTARDPLARGPFFKLLVLLHAPATWPTWLLALAPLLLAAVPAVLWSARLPTPALAAAVALVQLLFFLADIIILRLAPTLRISFGNWRGQFLALALPRTLAAAVLLALVPWLGFTTTLILLAALQLLGTALLAWASLVEPARLQPTHLRLTTDRLPTGTPPIRILHISDLHLERLSRRELDILAYVERKQPDLILITGDYVSISNNRDAKTYRQIRDLLSSLYAPYGIYATLGTPTVDLREWVVPLFEGLPVTLLREKWTRVDMGRGRGLALLGLDCTHELEQDGAAFRRLHRQVPVNLPQVLLHHSPEIMPEAVAAGVDLYLCGHTHGGQVRLPLVGPLLTGSKLGRRYVMGHYREGRTNLYVSRGVGFEGLAAPRVRLLAPPEITLITLRPA